MQLFSNLTSSTKSESVAFSKNITFYSKTTGAQTRQDYTVVIEIEPSLEAFVFYSISGSNKNSIEMEMEPMTVRPYDEIFFESFNQTLASYMARHPSPEGKITPAVVVLPNNLIAKDVITVPGVNKKTLYNFFKVALENRYSNMKDLRINSYVSQRNKRFTNFSLSVIRQDLLQKILQVCSKNNLIASIVTNSGNAMVDGLFAVNAKSRGGSFLFLDMKENYSKVAIVSNGVTMGSYDLPMGYSVMNNRKIVAENMYFDHTVASLAVYQAKARAKAKLSSIGAVEPSTVEQIAQKQENQYLTKPISQVTEKVGDDNADDEIAEDPLTKPVYHNIFEEDDPQQEEIDSMIAEQAENMQLENAKPSVKKKTPRILPKFMQRPLPLTEEGYEYENFRILEKWVLELARASVSLNGQIPFDLVYVNMPTRFHHVLDEANNGQSESGVKFVSAGFEKEKEIISQNAELYGALHSSQFNKNNNF